MIDEKGCLALRKLILRLWAQDDVVDVVNWFSGVVLELNNGCGFLDLQVGF